MIFIASHGDRRKTYDKCKCECSLGIVLLRPSGLTTDPTIRMSMGFTNINESQNLHWRCTMSPLRYAPTIMVRG